MRRTDLRVSGHGYYSYTLGAWHIIALNSDCSNTACTDEEEGSVTTVELRWLLANLAHHRHQCLLAYWHHPRFSSAAPGSDANLGPFWQLLFNAGADVVLNGHAHVYERFARQDPQGQSTPAGIREFIVGTGGRSLHDFERGFLPTSQAHDEKDFGVLFLTLRRASYSWQFRTVGNVVEDRGSAACHRARRGH
jgi:acid phosphatase type 7